MRQNKLKIFISGSNGFIGAHIKKKLIQKFNLITPSKNKLNLNNLKKVKKYIKKHKPDIIIHLAASTKFLSNRNSEKKNQIKNTFNLTKNLVKSINDECKLVIFFGSIEEYGNSKFPSRESQTVKPISIYGKYKYKSYLYVSKILKKKKLNYVWLRPSLTFGPGDNKERYLGYIINSIKKNKKFYVQPGNQIRDYLYINDLCKVLILIINNYQKKYNFVLNISSKNYIKIKSIPKMIEKILNKKINFNLKKLKKKEINLYNSNEKLLKLFPNLKFTSFKKGLINTLKDEYVL